MKPTGHCGDRLQQRSRRVSVHARVATTQTFEEDYKHFWAGHTGDGNQDESIAHKYIKTTVFHSSDHHGRSS